MFNFLSWSRRKTSFKFFIFDEPFEYLSSLLVRLYAAPVLAVGHLNFDLAIHHFCYPQREWTSVVVYQINDYVRSQIDQFS